MSIPGVREKVRRQHGLIRRFAQAQSPLLRLQNKPKSRTDGGIEVLFASGLPERIRQGRITRSGRRAKAATQSGGR
jgi:hypothetical protein